VLNTFVVFLSRIVGYIVDKAVFRTERGIGPVLHHRDRVPDLFGILASVIVACSRATASSAPTPARRGCSARRSR